jgi:molybdopterin/thiamine biosynthesis adenylyltransferase/rhodanese-related sulfurtransferase
MSFENNTRYARQVILPEMGIEGQKKLGNASVLIIGCGGLGGPVLTYLAAAGVGTIALVEFDIIAESNLHRQVIFDTKDIGKKKIEVAVQKIKDLNPLIKTELYQEGLNSGNALEIFSKYDLIVDGSDNFPTRYLVNDACEILNKPFVYGAIHQMEGQVAVFNFNGSSTYRDLFNSPPSPETAPNCATGGVLGPVAGVIGSLQALEAIKIISGIGKPLVDQILLVHFSEMIFRKMKIKKNLARSKVEKLIDYEAFCASEIKNPLAIYKNEFLELDNFTLIDIRENYEHEEFNIGGENIPQDEFEIKQLRENQKIVLYCSSGIRSKTLASKIKAKNPQLDIYYLACSLKEFV